MGISHAIVGCISRLLGAFYGAKPSDYPDSVNSIPSSPHGSVSTSLDVTPRLTYPELLGAPSFVLDPADLTPLSSDMDTCLQRINKDTVVKFGRGVRMSEAGAMFLAALETRVTVPTIQAAYVLDGVGYIVMSYEEGESLYDYWPSASPEQRLDITSQLADYFSQLRSVKGSFLGGVDYSPCADSIFQKRYSEHQPLTGPFNSESGFNEGLVRMLVERVPQDLRARFQPLKAHAELVERIHALSGHDFVLTHGDLNPGNILVRKNGTVVILDWGTACYLPDYWEYCRAKFNPWRDDWDDAIDRFIEPCEEFEIMRQLFYIAIN